MQIFKNKTTLLDDSPPLTTSRLRGDKRVDRMIPVAVQDVVLAAVELDRNALKYASPAVHYRHVAFLVQI